MNKSKYGHARQKTLLAKLVRMEEDADAFEFVWECLEEDGIIKDWEAGATQQEDVIVDARRLLNRYRRAREGRSYSSAWGEQRKKEGGEMQAVPVETTQRERDATETLRKYLAAHAARRPLVQKFRREHLWDGKLLTSAVRIEVFLALALGGDLDPEQNLLEQTLAPYRCRPSSSITFPLRVEPSAESDQVFTNEDMTQMIAEQQSNQERRLEARWVDPKKVWAQDSVEEGWSEVGGLLKELGEWLVNAYPWSDVGDAMVFVVSGRPPRVAEPISAAMDLSTATYSITFSRWVSEETVLNAYRTIASSHHHRVPGDKTIRVCNFVLEETDEEGHRPSWDTLLDRWNRENPQEAYSDRSAFSKAYKRAVEALVPPYLPLV